MYLLDITKRILLNNSMKKNISILIQSIFVTSIRRVDKLLYVLASRHYLATMCIIRDHQSRRTESRKRHEKRARCNSTSVLRTSGQQRNRTITRHSSVGEAK